MTSHAEANGNKLIQKLIPICPACNLSTANHSRAEFAVASGQEDIEKLVRLVRAKSWKPLRDIQSFKPTENAVVVDLLRCTDKTASLILRVSPFDLWEPDLLIEAIPLSTDETANLAKIRDLHP